MKYCCLLFALFFSSCATESNPSHDPEKDTEEAWVCHNPESPQHGELCELSTHPLQGEYETCYWTSNETRPEKIYRVENSFCWLIERADCTGQHEYEWQRENCHFFD